MLLAGLIARAAVPPQDSREGGSGE
jgi:hypothetical protein